MHTIHLNFIHIYRGYIYIYIYFFFFSVKDRNLCNRVDTIGNIFTSGAATCENITDGVHKMKIEIYFIEWTPSVIFSRVAQPRVKILPMVFTRWNKFRSFTEKNKYSVYFMLLILSGRSFIKIQYSSFPLFPVAYPFRLATHYNITSSARNVS